MTFWTLSVKNVATWSELSIFNAIKSKKGKIFHETVGNLCKFDGFLCAHIPTLHRMSREIRDNDDGNLVKLLFCKSCFLR